MLILKSSFVMQIAKILVMKINNKKINLKNKKISIKV